MSDDETKYRCGHCGNSKSFTETVWEQRRYPLDGAGETTGASDLVEYTEVPIEVSCDGCGKIVMEYGTTSPEILEYLKQMPEYWRDLPSDADREDFAGKYLEHFTGLFASMKTNEFDTIIQEYTSLAPDKRFVMNWLFTKLCGYSLPSIIERTHGYERSER